jgi:hypothetical protein
MADSSGNDPQRPGQHRLASGANTPMAKTIALVVVALVIGVVMINIVGDGGGSAAKTAKTTTTIAGTSNSTTATTAPGTTRTTGTTATTVKATPLTPATLSLVVLNAGAPQGSAANVAKALRTSGYTKQQPATTASFKQAGLTVHCQPGLDSERSALVKALDVPHYTATAGTWKALTGSDSTVQCYVTIGKPA